MPDVFREKIRKARMQHKCSQCGGAIEKRSHYIAISGLWEGEWRNYKVCMHCQEISQRFMKETGCCYQIPGLYEDLIDGDFLNFDEETEMWESSVDWLRVVSQKPLRCVVIGELEEVA